MEPNTEQAVSSLRGQGIPLNVPEWDKFKPSVYRFYAGAMAVGFSAGVVWTIPMLHYMTRAHALLALYSVVGVLLVLQIYMLIQDEKRRKAFTAASKRFREEIEMRYGVEAPKL